MKPIVDTEKQADLFVSQVDLSGFILFLFVLTLLNDCLNYFVQCFTDTNVYYEGLLNFKGTSQLRSLNLSQTPTMDDWCCDRLAYIFENSQLIDLDLSNCESITERGVAALGRIRSLKKVNIANTSASRSQNIELVILLFNEIRPDTHFQLE